MNQKELTKIFMMISNWKNPLVFEGLGVFRWREPQLQVTENSGLSNWRPSIYKKICIYLALYTQIYTVILYKYAIVSKIVSVLCFTVKRCFLKIIYMLYTILVVLMAQS